jgi:hypothetical protein
MTQPYPEGLANTLVETREDVFGHRLRGSQIQREYYVNQQFRV